MSLTEKIVKAISNPSKYAGLAAIALSLGCIPSPTLISVSDDGRYVAVPFKQNGEVYVGEKDNGWKEGNKEYLKFFIIDEETKKPEYIGDFYGLFHKFQIIEH